MADFTVHPLGRVNAYGIPSDFETRPLPQHQENVSMTDRIAWGPDSPGYPNCPVPPGTDCTVWFRDGNHARDSNPEGWTDWWDHERRGRRAGYDIIAYQPHAAAEQPDLLAAISTVRKTLQTALKLVDAIHDAERGRQ